MNTEHAITELLNFYIDAGVDEVIGETPVNHFDLPAPTAAVAAPAFKAKTAAPAPAPVQTTAAPSVLSVEAIAQAKSVASSCSSISELETAVRDFDGCSLKKMATNTVFARGNADADIMIIDRPAASEEDRSGTPFAGANGSLLDKMLASIGLSEKDVYFGCCLPWRPPGGRAPTREEQAICLPFIKRHIELAAPKTVILAGEAASFVLEQKTGINRLRGKWQSLSLGDNDFQALPIFHPAFLLEHPASKRQAWQDLLTLKAALDQQT